MSADLNGIRLAVIGGDDREIHLILELQKLGANITAVGFEDASKIEGITYKMNLLEVVSQIDALILPMYGIDEKGLVKAKHSQSPIVVDREVLQAIPTNVPLLIGFARPALKSVAGMLGIRIIETASLDQLTILNSIPSAEGAIQMAMESSKITIHGSACFVLGLGRCGWTLARMLKGIGANVTGVARKLAYLARAEEMGIIPLSFSDLKGEIGRADFVFNTVPQLVLDQETLDNVSKDVVIIDIASKPGGTDFDYASKLGIIATLAPGLPGKVAPKTAGKILAQVYPQLILRHLTTIMDHSFNLGVEVPKE